MRIEGNVAALQAHDRHYGIAGDFDLVRCASCGLIRLDPMPTEKQLLTYYPENYYAYLPQKQSIFWKQFLRHLLCLESKTHDPELSGAGNFLDIGCGSGTYLKLMAERGWKVSGVEPSRHGALAATSAGFDVFHGSLLDAGYPAASFDYVRSNHSFEHMPNPLEILQEIHRILRPGGKLFIGIPNTDSFTFRLFGRYWWYLCAPVHTYNYSTKTITTLLHRTGFQIEKVFYNSDAWGLLGSLQIFMNRNIGKKADDGWLVHNQFFRIFAHLAEKCIDRIHNGDKIEIISDKIDGSTRECLLQEQPKSI